MILMSRCTRVATEIVLVHVPVRSRRELVMAIKEQDHNRWWVCDNSSEAVRVTCLVETA